MRLLDFDPSLAAPRSLAAARRRALAAQWLWAERPVAERVAVLTRFRGLLAGDGRRLARLVASDRHRSPAETLAAEILPLAEACRFLERRAPRLLAARRLSRWTAPLWLAGNRARIERQPLGLVLLLAPANYPLFLPGVQALQALTAGNAVWWKPGAGGGAGARAMATLLAEAGLEPDLLSVLGEDAEDGRAAVAEGVDHVVLTGSADTGRRVLSALAPQLTPATLELSGCDAAFVLADADVALAADALAFGTTFNGGATCIAPRRAFVARGRLRELETALAARLAGGPEVALEPRTAARALELVRRAEARGGRRVCGRFAGRRRMTPLVLTWPAALEPIPADDLFAPLLTLVGVDGPEHALELAARSPYALGASVFGGRRSAADLARRVPGGVVTVNDVIVPTADPRLPFGGHGDSGYGITRGDEGLLGLTRPRVVIETRGPRPHHAAPPPGAEDLFAAYLETVHGSSRRCRARALGRLVGAARRALAFRKRIPI